jgi:hypothetical protein
VEEARQYSAVKDVGISLVVLAFGAFLAIRCCRAGVYELRAGTAKGGMWGAYSREGSPVGFWLIVAATFMASLLGMIFAAFGFVGLLAYSGATS